MPTHSNRLEVDISSGNLDEKSERDEWKGGGAAKYLERSAENAEFNEGHLCGAEESGDLSMGGCWDVEKQGGSYKRKRDFVRYSLSQPSNRSLSRLESAADSAATLSTECDCVFPARFRVPAARC